MTREFKGWHMLAIMLVFFGVIIGVNLTMAVVASQSWTGLIVKNGYVASQDFNEKLAEADRQSRLGWASDIAFADRVLSVTLHDANGDPVRLDRLNGIVGRPVFEQDDREVAFEYLGNGIYVTDAELAPGPWSVTLDGLLATTPYRREARLIVAESGEGRLE